MGQQSESERTSDVLFLSIVGAAFFGITWRLPTRRLLLPSTSAPPELTESQQSELLLLATTYALSHGILYLPAGSLQPLTPNSPIHAPISLFPTPFPCKLFELAQRLQSVYNVLYARISMDEEFLDELMGEDGVGQVDPFMMGLWRAWKDVREQKRLNFLQPLQLGLFRSDYLLHVSKEATGVVSLKQVEFNTISSSFGPLSERVAALHRYLYASTGYFETPPCFSPHQFPPNSTTRGLAEGLAEAHKAYGHPKAVILFVVQAGERNVFDQRWLEYKLLDEYGIKVIRRTFDQLSDSAKINSETFALTVHGFPADPVEVSVVYYRAGYGPADYPTAGHYKMRMILEQSRAIQCPSIALQLAGSKKVQQELTKPGVLERFLGNKGRPRSERVFSQRELVELKESWVTMWGLDEDPDEMSGLEGVDRARRDASNLVLKPQREGGGNNIYTDDIPAFLDALPPADRRAWIAMELIRPPEASTSYLASAATGGLLKSYSVSELGIFGYALFGYPDGKIKEKEVGWLVRTKQRNSNEGGVAAGYSFLDSPLLVNG